MIKLCSCGTHGCHKQSAIAKVRKTNSSKKQTRNLRDSPPYLSDSCKWTGSSSCPKGCFFMKSWESWVMGICPLSSTAISIFLWLGASHNLLSHKASTIHQTSSWNESSINMWQVVSCFPAQPFFLQGLHATLAFGISTLHEDHRLKFRFLTKTARWLVSSTLELRLWEASL